MINHAVFTSPTEQTMRSTIRSLNALPAQHSERTARTVVSSYSEVLINRPMTRPPVTYGGGRRYRQAMATMAKFMVLLDKVLRVSTDPKVSLSISVRHKAIWSKDLAQKILILNGRSPCLMEDAIDWLFNKREGQGGRLRKLNTMILGTTVLATPFVLLSSVATAGIGAGVILGAGATFYGATRVERAVRNQAMARRFNAGERLENEILPQLQDIAEQVIPGVLDHIDSCWVELGCHHQFHKDCLDQWLNTPVLSESLVRRHDECPCCRGEVTDVVPLAEDPDLECVICLDH